MNKTQIHAEIVGHSLSPQGDELISVLATFPRIILSEINTHRMLSKNTSSSRAIPFNKMVEAVKENPFIPIAWQKEHTGMQGTEYLVDRKHENAVYEWLKARDFAVKQANIMNSDGVTKQLANRLLEPFMWTTMLITGSKEGWDNFFKLRCGVYSIHGCEEDEGEILDFKSKKEVISYYESKNYPMNKCYIGNNPYTDEERFGGTIDEMTDLDWLKINKGMAEIHIMALAESIWDAVNESTPKLLEMNQWHIPFIDKINSEELNDILNEINYVPKNIINGVDFLTQAEINISVALAARTSYTVVGEEKGLNYENLIGLHNRLLTQDPPHSSPFEHCCVVPTQEEYNNSIKGQEQGWFMNYHGFKSYRQIVDESK